MMGSILFRPSSSGIAKGLSRWVTCPPGGPGWGQKWGKWGKIWKRMMKIWRKMRKVDLLPTRNCEAGYAAAIKGSVRKKYTSGPRYWNVPVLVNTGTFLVYQYYPKMWYLRSLERAGGIQKQTILECKNGLVLSNTHVPVSGTWSILFPSILFRTDQRN